MDADFFPNLKIIAILNLAKPLHVADYKRVNIMKDALLHKKLNMGDNNTIIPYVFQAYLL